MAAGPIQERNQDATIYVGGIDERVTESLLWELFQQAGPVVNVHIPKDRITNVHSGYGFVEFLGEEDADYAMKIMNMIKLYGKPIKVNKASANQKQLDVGANIFIGNLDPEVDEKLLYDTFSAFGIILQSPKIMRDPDSGNSKGFAFINFANFEASDAAIEAMNGQYLCNRPITISYAFKKDGKGERHGTAAERLLAAQNPLPLGERPHQLFADKPFMLPPPPPPPFKSGGSMIPPIVMNSNPNLQATMMGGYMLPPPPPMFGAGGVPMMAQTHPTMMYPPQPPMAGNMMNAQPNALFLPPPPPPPSHLSMAANLNPPTLSAPSNELDSSKARGSTGDGMPNPASQSMPPPPVPINNGMNPQQLAPNVATSQPQHLFPPPPPPSVLS